MPELRWILLIAGAVILFSIYWWGRRNAARNEQRETIVRSRSEPLITADEDVRSEPSLGRVDEDEDPPWVEPADTQPSSAHTPASSFDADDDEPEIIQAPAATGRREPVVSSDFEADAALTTHSSAHNETAREIEDDCLAAKSPETRSPAAREEVVPPARKPTPRKIVVLRLAAGEKKIPGDKLREALITEGLTFGKYEIFHRLHPSGTTLFSVASMVEPGSFDLSRMDLMQYPGVTLFLQLPAANAGLPVFENMLECAKNMQSALGGAIQDERGTLLNTPRLQRIRQDIVDFEALHADAT